jgi:3-oxoacyl-[acyl-carrier protein] reductase
MAEREFAGRVALVTGGARGIGRACCEALAAAGADVAINYRTSEAAARETLARVRAAGARGCAVRADVSSPAEVQRLIAEVTAQLGPVDLLVNNAGVFDQASHADTTLEIWQRALDNNLTSAYLVTWAVKDSMIERGFGRIVNVASVAGLRPRPLSIAYSVSKAGLIGLTRSLAEGVAGANLRVNAIAPGLIDTEILSDVPQVQLDAIIAATPMQRIGTPAEMAQVVMFLLSERSSYMTGQTLVSSGGRVMLP